MVGHKSVVYLLTGLVVVLDLKRYCLLRTTCRVTFFNTLAFVAFSTLLLRYGTVATLDSDLNASYLLLACCTRFIYCFNVAFFGYGLKRDSTHCCRVRFTSGTFQSSIFLFVFGTLCACTFRSAVLSVACT